MDSKRNACLYTPVKFLRASSTLETLTSLNKCSDTTPLSEPGSGLSGVEAKMFYETLCKESNEKQVQRRLKSTEDQSDRKPASTEICHPGTEREGREPFFRRRKKDFRLRRSSKSREVNVFLKMAQDGDIHGLRGILEDGEQDINVTDQFGWTALMCACHSGQKSCVKFLLKQGARTDLCNSKEETAEDIAGLVGNRHLQDLFHKHKKRKREDSSIGKLSYASQVEELFCEICNLEFTCTRPEHNSSTAHLFNCQYKSDRTLYHIPESNIGFQLMKKTGWNQEKGLGPEGTGRKFPVKTVLKQDRQGLGSKQKGKARITHFSPNDSTAVKTTKCDTNGRRVTRRTSKRKILERQAKERKWEHDMRVYMNTD